MKGIDKEKWNRFTPESTVQRCTVLFYPHFLYAKNPVSYKFSVPVFQSTPSAWRVTRQIVHHMTAIRFQSTPSAWRVTLSIPAVLAQLNISIHTLRMEGDEIMASVAGRYSSISIHTLRMEGDGQMQPAPLTLRDFNPHPPHGG